jgi:hypothetical protein
MAEAKRTVRRFFEELLPAAIAKRARAFGRTQGALTLIVEGVGSWTVTFGDAASPAALVDEADIDADCIAVWGADDFAALIGPDAPAAVAPIALVGEATLLARLGALLGPPADRGLGAALSALAA